MSDFEHTYILPEFTSYKVTESGEIFRTLQLKRGQKVVRIMPSEEGVVNLISDEGKRHRYPLQRIIICARQGIDVRTPEATEAVNRETKCYLVPSLVKRVSESQGDFDRQDHIIQDIVNVLCSALRRQGDGTVDEGMMARVAVVANLLLSFYQITAAIRQLSSPVEVEISREGNERKSVSSLYREQRETAKSVLDGMEALGISYKEVSSELKQSKMQALDMFEVQQKEEDTEELL